MRDKYRDLYEELFDTYLLGFQVGPGASLDYIDWFRARWSFSLARETRRIARSIRRLDLGNAGDREVQIRLRPDAEHFLLINVHQMILLPIYLSEQLPEELDVQDAIERDIETVVRTAALIAREEEATLAQRDEVGGIEVKGIHVMRATAMEWQSLATNRIAAIWGDHE